MEKSTLAKKNAEFNADLNSAEAVKIEDQVNKHKQQEGMMLQFVSHANGRRSEPFMSTWTQLREMLLARPEQDEQQVNDKDYILLVAVMAGEETQIPSTPLITVETFLNITPVGNENE